MSKIERVKAAAIKQAADPRIENVEPSHEVYEDALQGEPMCAESWMQFNASYWAEALRIYKAGGNR